ncbi:hypothetical protein FRC06_010925 [Ceratobasidium sp. 370]|nr:hypothetical protein FRC06_010925 [Ceratobasidium sp. 370]
MDLDDGNLGVEGVNTGELMQPADAIELDGSGPVLDGLGAAQDNLGAAQGNLGVDILHAPAQGLRRNPPVTIEDWPEPDLDPHDHEDGLEDGLGDDPEPVEMDVQPDLDPLVEPRLTDEEARRVLNLHLGDLAEEEWFDMCKYKDLEHCPFCNQPRYGAHGRVRRSFRYTPLIPQLRGLFQSRDMAAKLRYRVRAEQEYDPDVIQDVFDGENYRSLRGTQPSPNSEYRMFDNPEDIALGFSTDGVDLFKWRQRGNSTAWPLIFINYNLHPEFRTRL